MTLSSRRVYVGNIYPGNGFVPDCPKPLSAPVLSKPQYLSGVPDYFGRNKISSGGDLSHYSSASLY